jgi:hypothetical protein
MTKKRLKIFQSTISEKNLISFYFSVTPFSFA